MSHYATAAQGWAAGPGLVYDALAEAIVATSLEGLAGKLLLDLGCGSGAVSAAARRRGAIVVAADVEPAMVAGNSHALVALTADAASLPLRDHDFDVVVAAFLLSHVAAPAAVLREAGRVTRAGGCIVAAGFGDSHHPVKAAVDGVATSMGFVPPRWYAELKVQEARLASATALHDLAAAAGVGPATVTEILVDCGLGSPRGLLAWRLGMAHLAPFVAGLAPAARAHLEASALRAIGDQPPPLRLPVLVLSIQAVA